MPNYRYRCTDCGETFEEWRSIHAEPLTVHSVCGSGRIAQVFTAVATYGIGNRGAKTVEVDAREGRWDRDMPAYQRFRNKGLQPRHIDGCDKLEATAKGRWHVETGLAHTDRSVEEARDLAREIMAGRA